MNTDEIKQLAINALEDMKALDMQVLDVRDIATFTDVMIITCGSSSRHVKSIANNLVMEAKKQGIPPLSSEGDDVGEWVLVDMGDVVVHVMQPQIRDFYNLEKLWTIKPGEEQAD